MPVERNWAYYREAAVRTGMIERVVPATGEKEEVEARYSLRQYFQGPAAEQNALVRAFLGDEAAMDSLPWEEGARERRALRQSVEENVLDPLNDSQKAAICSALAGPVAIIQGPPGTGKTRTIVNLLACIHALYPERTVAVVSSNNAAVDNVFEKLMEICGELTGAGDARGQSLLDAFSYLGSQERRGAMLKHLGMAKAYPNGKPDADYLRVRPLFSSTIHSLRKCFDLEEQVFDYVVVDECSQASCLLGVMAMGCARRLVLLGDAEQLPPVIDERHAAVGGRFADVEPVFKDREGHSFLAACRERFPRAEFTLLNEHYRCHPGIAGFFARYYGGALRIKRSESGCPIFVRWYEGNYWEQQGTRKLRQDKRTFQAINWEKKKIEYSAALPEENETPEEAEARRTRTRACYVNEKQIQVFLRELWPGFKARLAENRNREEKDRISLCVISPYVYQLYRLKEELDRDPEWRELTALLGGNEEDPLPRLTIHESQGREYTIVCYLPVEDACPENQWPNSQKKRMVNVAVSRAMEEFYLITSANWLPEELQREALDHEPLPMRRGRAEAGDDQLQLMELIDYAWRHGGSVERSGITSIFDRVPLLRREAAGGEDSAPARCLEELLRTMAPELGFHVYRELDLSRAVPLENREPRPEDVAALRERLPAEAEAAGLEPGSVTPPTAEELTRFLLASDSRIDFTLVGEDGLARFIEVDGAYHRQKDDTSQWLADRKKDFWLKTALGGSLLRLPTDGTTEGEAGLVRGLMAAAGTPLVPSDAWSARKNELLARLRETLDECRKGVAAFCSAPDPEDPDSLDALREDLAYQAKLRLLANVSDYSDPTGNEFGYGEETMNQFYFCRYGAAYAYEYAWLYRVILEDYVRCLRQRQEAEAREWDPLGVYSFGCGSLLDAWSLAYAQADLALRWEEYKDLMLFWKGTDLALWPIRIIAPRRTNGVYTPKERRDALSEDFGQLELTWGEEQGDAVAFLRSQDALNHNILLFPKILNELPEQVVDALAEALSQVPLALDQYYIGISHSRSRSKEGLLAADKLVRVFRERGFRAVDLLADGALSQVLEARTLRDCVGEQLLTASAQLVSLLRRDFAFGRLCQTLDADTQKKLEEAGSMDWKELRNAVGDIMNSEGGEAFLDALRRRKPAGDGSSPFDVRLLNVYADSSFDALLDVWRADTDCLPLYQPQSSEDVSPYIYIRDPGFSSTELTKTAELISKLSNHSEANRQAAAEATVRNTVVTVNNMAFQLIRLDRTPD